MDFIFTLMTFIILQATTTTTDDIQTIATILIALLGGGGGLIVGLKAFLDYRLKSQAQIATKDRKLVDHLDHRINYLDQKVLVLEEKLDEERMYVAILTRALAKAGLDIPEQKQGE